MKFEIRSPCRSRGRSGDPMTETREGTDVVERAAMAHCAKAVDLGLRDWFAGQALVGLIASNDPGAGDRIEEIPWYAYSIADAMLAARTAREASDAG